GAPDGTDAAAPPRAHRIDRRGARGGGWIRPVARELDRALRWRCRGRRPGAGARRQCDPRFTSRRADGDRRSRSADAILPEAAADGGVCVVLPLVALVGRPNVGKSTLFNRIVGKRLAIVQDVPGVTRDRQYAEAQQGAKRFRVVDTGGFTLRTDEQLVRAVREQAD